MENKELKKLLVEQHKQTTQQINGLKKYVDKKFEQVDKKFEAIDQKIDENFAASQEQADHHLMAMQEHFDSKIAGVMELIQDIPVIKARLDMTFDKAGETAADHEITKLVVKEHSQDIAKLKAR